MINKGCEVYIRLGGDLYRCDRVEILPFKEDQNSSHYPSYSFFGCARDIVADVYIDGIKQRTYTDTHHSEVIVRSCE